MYITQDTTKQEVTIWPKGGLTETVVIVRKDEIVINRPSGPPERIKL